MKSTNLKCLQTNDFTDISITDFIILYWVFFQKVQLKGYCGLWLNEMGLFTATVSMQISRYCDILTWLLIVKHNLSRIHFPYLFYQLVNDRGPVNDSHLVNDQCPTYIDYKVCMHWPMFTFTRIKVCCIDPICNKSCSCKVLNAFWTCLDITFVQNCLFEWGN